VESIAAITYKKGQIVAASLMIGEV